MTPRTLALLLLCVLSPGCASEEDPRSELTSRTFVWTTESRPYEILGIGGSNVPRIGDQARSASVIYAELDDRSKVAEAVNEIYAELKADIEDTQPDAQYRRVNIMVYDVEGDIQHDAEAWICSLSVTPETGDVLPNDPTDLVKWQWRDPSQRPTQEERQIDWDYRDALKLANDSVEFGINTLRFAGLHAAERRAVYEETYPEEAAAAREQLAKENKMTAEELQAVLDRVVAWKYAEEIVASVPVEETAPESDDPAPPETEESSAPSTETPEPSEPAAE